MAGRGASHLSLQVGEQLAAEQRAEAGSRVAERARAESSLPHPAGRARPAGGRAPTSSSPGGGGATPLSFSFAPAESGPLQRIGRTRAGGTSGSGLEFPTRARLEME